MLAQPKHPVFNGKITLVTGELSGEMHAVHLIKTIAESIDVSWSGIGGDKLREIGVEVVYDYRHISLTGLTEIFSKYAEIRNAYNSLKRHLLAIRPSLLVLVDFPGFNLKIARFAKKHGIPVVYFIAPQVWAWRKKRIEQIKKSVDRVICIMPFEKTLYDAHGIDAVYVGHPFATTVKPPHRKVEFMRMIGVHDAGPIITIMPGSRENEIRRHLPIMLEVVDRLREEHPGMTVLLPVADNMSLGSVERLLGHHTDIRPLKGFTYDTLSSSDLAIIASGSATLEAALLGVPSIVLYKISLISYLAAKIMVQVKYISLPNIIAGKEIFPEFIQRITVEDVAQKAIYMLNNEREEKIKDMENMRIKLGAFDSYRLAADSIVQLLESLYGALPKAP